ncbi:sigma-54 dependent transcriptional regulator [Teredinibacter sp. KSP-S5-2]|uniref:sigma-54 interaction domain-containing protein n=1 Tax=Teredinibacter sp. KSP-S5-2 TaxID=3034506 RepID=UPI0029344B5F|nr:sigma-54 dependent transcriptional regulator [Teredinibacter sp. KSP-S5-2]WNO11642.1 sigma-54 dependent transcriptional regulator [Teredinibacter sp. KSP-S5-2]
MIPSEELLKLTLLGESEVINQLQQRIIKTARFDAPVLIHGETGTGKELVARSLHYCSNRSDNAFVPVNCGALSDELFLSEIFGHEKGAFTDAKKTKSGLLEQANEGTLFLDEIDSLSLKSQVALLRFLQENEYRSVGGEQNKQANVRVLSASNRDIKKLVSEGLFREDLFYRLEVLTIDVPPLRDREDDVVLLTQHFMEQVCQQHKLPMKSLSPTTKEWLIHYEWPGNVRELENWVMRRCFLTEGVFLQIEEDQSSSGVEDKCTAQIGSFKDEKNRAIEEFESSYVNKILAQCSGNISRAAKIANKDRRAFGRLVKKYGVNRELFC